VADEIMCGFGRCGEWSLSSIDGLRPDILLLGKGLGGGYPVSALLIRRELAEGTAFVAPSAASSSYGGSPVSRAAIVATGRILEDEELLARSRRLGVEARRYLRERLSSSGVVTYVEGRGLAVGIGLSGGNDQAEALAKVVASLGVIVMLGASSIRLYPPICIDEALLFDGLQRLVSGILQVRAP
jgi:4-aminobutyrate aminotransferase/4-aminobutyrate aminotransferase/(S)-3-amino-2-methylpropionate transaminase